MIALIGLSSEKDLTHSKSILEEREQEREIHTPDCFNTGRGSPVRLDSSTVLLPPVTTPSTGMRSCQIQQQLFEGKLYAKLGLFVKFEKIHKVVI